MFLYSVNYLVIVGVGHIETALWPAPRHPQGVLESRLPPLAIHIPIGKQVLRVCVNFLSSYLLLTSSLCQYQRRKRVYIVTTCKHTNSQYSHSHMHTDTHSHTHSHTLTHTQNWAMHAVCTRGSIAPPTTAFTLPLAVDTALMVLLSLSATYR